MLNDETVRKLKSDGWEFYWDGTTGFIDAQHSSGGQFTICEIKPSVHFDNGEVGKLLARTLNNCLSK